MSGEREGELAEFLRKLEELGREFERIRDILDRHPHLGPRAPFTQENYERARERTFALLNDVDEQAATFKPSSISAGERPSLKENTGRALEIIQSIRRHVAQDPEAWHQKLARKRQTAAPHTPGGMETPSQRTVFVVHGRDEHLRRSMFDFLRSLGLQALEWSQAIKGTRDASPYVGQILEVAFRDAQAVVVMLTPDDKAYLRPDLRKDGDPDYETTLTGQARPNVLFEAGMALATHPDRTVIVQIGNVRPFSDIAGRHIVQLDDSVGRRQDVAERLRIAGCAVDISGRDWHSSGDFRLSTA